MSIPQRIVQERPVIYRQTNTASGNPKAKEYKVDREHRQGKIQ